MSFILDNEESHFFPVQVPMLDKDGRKRQFQFDAEFTRLPQAELEELLARVREGAKNDNPVKDSEILDRVLIGWRKVQDSEGRELEVNADNRHRLLQKVPVQSCIVKAWMKSLGFDGKLGN